MSKNPPDKLRDYLQNVRPEGLLNICAFHPQNKSSNTYTFNLPDEIEDAVNYVLEQNEFRNTYLTYNPTLTVLNKKPAKTDIADSEYFWAELDPKDFMDSTIENPTTRYNKARQKILHLVNDIEFDFNPTFIVDSGNGIQCIWRHELLLTHDEAELICQKLERKFTETFKCKMDSTYSIDHLMRLPFTKNYPNQTKLDYGYPEKPQQATVLVSNPDAVFDETLVDDIELEIEENIKEPTPEGKVKLCKEDKQWLYGEWKKYIFTPDNHGKYPKYSYVDKKEDIIIIDYKDILNFTSEFKHPKIDHSAALYSLFCQLAYYCHKNTSFMLQVLRKYPVYEQYALPKYKNKKAILKQLKKSADAQHNIFPIKRPKVKGSWGAFKHMSATNRLDEMKTNLCKTDYVIKNMALAGQVTMFYGKPNTGKTLLMLHFVKEAVTDGRINGDDVLYVNADDDYEGLYIKSQIMADLGCLMVSPANSDISNADIIQMLKDMCEGEELKGKIIIFDTVKKFVDVMQKALQKEFYELLNRLTNKQATIILLGHTNKHTDKDGNIIFSGTQDTEDDVSCLYSMYRLSERAEEEQVVEFRNEKSRGKISRNEVYTYTRDSITEKDYKLMLDSCRHVNKADAETYKNKINKDEIRNKFLAEILHIKHLLETGDKSRTEIHKLFEQPPEGLTASGLKRALEKLDGIEWRSIRIKKENNKRLFTLMPSVDFENDGI